MQIKVQHTNISHFIHIKSIKKRTLSCRKT